MEPSAFLTLMATRYDNFPNLFKIAQWKSSNYDGVNVTDDVIGSATSVPRIKAYVVKDFIL